MVILAHNNPSKILFLLMGVVCLSVLVVEVVVLVVVVVVVELLGDPGHIFSTQKLFNLSKYFIVRRRSQYSQGGTPRLGIPYNIFSRYLLFISRKHSSIMSACLFWQKVEIIREYVTAICSAVWILEAMASLGIHWLNVPVIAIELFSKLKI